MKLSKLLGKIIKIGSKLVYYNIFAPDGLFLITLLNKCLYMCVSQSKTKILSFLVDGKRRESLTDQPFPCQALEI